MPKSRSYKEHLHKRLQEPGAAAAYLNAALEDDDIHVFLMALRDITQAQGGMGHLSKGAELNRESLCKALSMRGNPRLSSLRSVLGACGLVLAIQPAHHSAEQGRKAIV